MPYKKLPGTKLPTKSQVKSVFRKNQKKALIDGARFVRAKAADYPQKSASIWYKRTGTLGKSITYTKPHKQFLAWQIEVGTNLHYARYVEEGTGIFGPKRQPIKPKRAKVLAWAATGSVAAKRGRLIAMGIRKRKGRLRPSPSRNVYMVFFKSVKGFKGWHYMEKAFKSPETTAYLQARLQRMYQDIARDIAKAFGVTI